MLTNKLGLKPGETIDCNDPSRAKERLSFEANLLASSPEADLSVNPETGCYRNVYLQAALEGWIGRAVYQPPEDLIYFNKEVPLGPVEISPGRSSYPVKVSFDGAEGQGRVWLMDSEDNWVAIEGKQHARTVAKLLNAWADTYPEEA